jgi:hypothetical protein
MRTGAPAAQIGRTHAVHVRRPCTVHAAAPNAIRGPVRACRPSASHPSGRIMGGALMKGLRAVHAATATLAGIR